MSESKEISGVIFDPVRREKIPGKILIRNGKIEKVLRDENVKSPIILPGFVDSHIHIESSMLSPTAFSDAAIKHGTIAVVADPHEIANVAGVTGIDYMINDASRASMKFYFGAPSCVPASPFDDCYKALDSNELEVILQRDDIFFLGEMMNFPGVIHQDPDVIKKIELAKKFNKKIDGHAPGLTSDDLEKYALSGISTDHECFTIEEALEKIKLGMKVLVREGSAAKNFNALHTLITKHFKNIMFCTDDCHPDDLLKGHINLLFKKSLRLGYSIFDLLQITSINPVKHYGLNVGLLQEGDPADFIIIDNLNDLNILSTFIDGQDVLCSVVNTNTMMTEEVGSYTFISSFDHSKVKLIAKTPRAKVIEVVEGELITGCSISKVKTDGKEVVADLDNDILKIVVLNRYKKNEIGVGLIKGFGFKKGAIGESIAHDSHHIIAVGADDESILKCLDYVLDNKGGIGYYDGTEMFGLPLPIYGLMSSESAPVVASLYSNINSRVINNGCNLKAPFMTLSFMALTVIPKLKISPRGLFDVEQFGFVEQFV